MPGAETADRPVAAPREPRPSVESANLRMWLPLVGLGLGILLGLTLNVSVTPDLARYSAVAILAGLDSILGAVRAELDGHYDNRVFLSGFIANTAVAVAADLRRVTGWGSTSTSSPSSPSASGSSRTWRSFAATSCKVGRRSRRT